MAADVPHRAEVPDFGFDIFQTAKQYVFSTKLIHKNCFKFTSDIIKDAIRRYELLWLPFANTFQENVKLTAPLDIELIWQVHLLRPLKYQEDLIGCYGNLINHHLLFGNEEEKDQSYNETKQLWDETYPGECFDVLAQPKEDAKSSTTSATSTTETKFMDIDRVMKDVTNYFAFIYQISLSHFTDDKYIKDSIDRYKKHIHLVKTHAENFQNIIPYLDICLIWHSHMQCPHSYQQYFLQVLGRGLPYKISMALNQSNILTIELWRDYLSEKHNRNGAAKRNTTGIGGTIPSCNEIDLWHMSRKTCRVRIRYVHMLELPSIESLTMKLQYPSTNGKTILKLHARTSKDNPHPTIEWAEPNNCVEYEAHAARPGHDTLKFLLRTSRSWLHQELASCIINIQSIIKASQTMQNVSFTTNECDIEMPDVKSTCKLIMELAVSPVLSPIELQVYNGPFGDCTEEFLMTLPKGVISRTGDPSEHHFYQVATHRLVNSCNGEELFAVQVIISVRLKVLVVMLIRFGQVMAIGQLVGPGVLPSSKQVGGSCITLDYDGGERSMLIHGQGQPDWAIVNACWKGGVQVELYELSHRTKRSIKVSHSTNENLLLKDTKFNLKSGMIILEPTENLHERIVMVFCIGALFNVCKLRPHAECSTAMVSNRISGDIWNKSIVVSMGGLTATPDNVGVEAQTLAKYRKLFDYYGEFAANLRQSEYANRGSEAIPWTVHSLPSQPSRSRHVITNPSQRHSVGGPPVQAAGHQVPSNLRHSTGASNIPYGAYNDIVPPPAPTQPSGYAPPPYTPRGASAGLSQRAWNEMENEAPPPYTAIAGPDIQGSQDGAAQNTGANSTQPAVDSPPPPYQQ
ncbi:unnamed protein product [Owenia fusiformis]|uniref:Uncharacterized protein n=1 Tax=Owenia fusiformis TaxID=6347 RepID=A0A8S4NS83_OWEFU|nr:unnamed protein product [Owenia fusiformis]